jgi:hypothetical protein
MSSEKKDIKEDYGKVLIRLLSLEYIPYVDYTLSKTNTLIEHINNK